MFHTTETTSALDQKTSTINEPPQETEKSLARRDFAWLVLALAVLFVLYRSVFAWLSDVWSNNSDYSHGFLVPVFAAYILWSNRRSLITIRDGEQTAQGIVQANSGLLIGGCLIGIGLVMRVAGIYMRIRTIEGVSLIPFVLGIFTILFGSRAARWCAPPVLFLLFMIPLPSSVSGQLSGLLQTVATTVSTFAFQIFGIPAYAQGNVISLSNGEIGVAEACSGLRMLYAFFALTVGACMVIDRTWPEKAVIALSAIPIAIIANCIRIIATGFAYEYLDPETAGHIFHDVAGWLMMPIGFTILLGVLGILDSLIVPDDSFPIHSKLR